MVSMQLFSKEIEYPPGASSAASILTRNLQTHGLDSKRSSEVKVLVFCVHCLIVECLLVNLPTSDFNIFVPDFLIICICRILFGNYVHGGI
jgi:hypothetical protein